MPEWGGPRPGAGRKPKLSGETRVTLSARISQPSLERLHAYARQSGKSLGEILDGLVGFVEGRPGFEEFLIPADEVQPPSPKPPEAKTTE